MPVPNLTSFPSLSVPTQNHRGKLNLLVLQVVSSEWRYPYLIWFYLSLGVTHKRLSNSFVSEFFENLKLK